MSHLLKQAFDFLAGRCDWAATLDGAGFNAFDAEFGHRMADTPYDEWTTKQRKYAYKVARKYRGQLLLANIDFDEIPEPKANESLEEQKKEQKKKLVAERSVRFKKDSFEIRWPKKDPEWGQILDAVRDIPGRKFHNEPPAPFWTVPQLAGSFEKFNEMINKFDFSLDGYAKQQLDLLENSHDKMTAEAEKKTARDIERKKLAGASDVDLDVAGLGGVLRPFQKVAVKFASLTKRVLLTDVMGLGKTVEALATLEYLDAFPTVVVCPASLKYNWLKEATKWLPNRRTCVYENGRIPEDVDIVIVNYERLFVWSKKGQRETETRLRPAVEEFKARGINGLVVDESHNVKNQKAKRTVAVQALAKNVDVRLLLTGTPVLNRPVELISQLDVLDKLKSEFGGFWTFAQRYCGAKHNGYGWDFGGHSNLGELNERLRASCMLRRTKEEVLPELPAKQRASIPVDITNREEYERAEDDLLGWVAEKAASDVDFLAEIADLPEEEQKLRRLERAEDKAYRASRAETLVRIEALKQIAARGKLVAVKEWIENVLDSGEKLVVFAHHQEVQQALLGEFPDAARLLAEDNPQERQAQVDRFQENDTCRLMICSLTVGREGITLTASSNVAFVELGWTPALHDQAEDRCHRIGQEDSVTAWYLLAHDTIDEEIAELIEKKRDVVDQTTDGKPAGQAGNILVDLLEKLRERRAA